MSSYQLALSVLFFLVCCFFAGVFCGGLYGSYFFLFFGFLCAVLCV